jgi:peptide/nickel transport system substrate-binding protein
MQARLGKLTAFVVLMSAVVFAAPTLAQKQGGTLRVYHRDNPPSASIHEEATISTVMPFMSVFNNLVVFDPKSPQNSLEAIIPELATGWAWSEDRTNLTFKLRSGVKWHDGKPFSSADVKCTWDMLIHDDGKLRKNPRKPWYGNLKEVTVNGAEEVTFHLGRPQPAFLVFLAGGLSPVYPCHVSAADMRTRPIGTGPFKFAEFHPNESIKLVRNPNYWKPGLPHLDAIEFTIVSNRATAVLAFIAGRFDLTFSSEVTVPLLKDIKSQAPQAVCQLNSSNTHVNLMVNRDKPPFDDAKIRRAMMLALDRKAFIDALTDGQAGIGGAMLPPPEGLWGMPPELLKSVPGYDPDVGKSREAGRAIMQGLGYGPNKPVKIKVATRNIPAYRDPAVILIDQLKQVYFDGELEVIDTSLWYTRLARKDYFVALNVTGVGIDDPDVNFYENYACSSDRNYTRYCNPEIEKLFDQQSAMSDQAQRRQLVWQIDRQLQEDGARPIIFHSRDATCWQPYVRGIAIALNTIYNHWRFEDVWLDR